MRVLEPRILLDAAGAETEQNMSEQAGHVELANAAGKDAAPTGDSGDSDDASETEGAQARRDLSRDVVFIDGGVDNIGQLLGEIDPDVEVHILDLQSDGVEQIADILDGRQDLLAVHIFSHGGEGVLNLGSDQLSSQTITTTHVEALNQIGSALGDDGDILIYGCDFGSGSLGSLAAQQLSQATGADIAASDDLTGAEDLGGDWDLEVSSGLIEAKAFQATGYKGVLGAFELGTVDAPTVTYVNEIVPATAPGFGSVGEAGTVAIWSNAGTVETESGPVQVDVRATVVSVSDANNIFVGFGTRDDDDGDADNPLLDDFRVYVYNDTAVAGGSNSGTIGSATIVWEIFENGTNQTVRADIGEVSLTTADIDGVGPGTVTTRETLAAALSDLSSYTVQAGTNLEVSNDGVNLRATGTADQNSEESSWVQYSWNSINQLTMIYETRTPYAYYNHDGDGDLVFTNPETAYATGIDLDLNDSSGASGSNYQTIYYSNATNGTPVAIADGDVTVSNAANRVTHATVTLTNAMSGDQLNVQTSILSSLGLTGVVDTSVPGVITATLSGNASAIDYQTAIQSITYENTNYGSIDVTPRSVDVQVFDGAFASGIANTAVTFGTIINQPTADRDLYVGQEDTALLVDAAGGLLANDTDPNSVSISIVSATDANGVVIPVNVTGAAAPVSHTLPSGAMVTLFDDGSFEYVPLADYSGVEYFDYTVRNVNGFIGQSYAAINIQGVADDAVLPVGLISGAADEGNQSATVDLTSVQGDSDGSESLQYSLSQVPSGFVVTDGVESYTSTGLADIVDLEGWDLTTVSLIPPGSAADSDLDVTIQLIVDSTEPNGSTSSETGNVTFRFDAVADVPLLTLTNGSAGPGAMMNLSPLISASVVDNDGSEEIASYQFSNIPPGATLFIGAVAQAQSGGIVTVSAADFAALRLQAPTGLATYTMDVTAISAEVNAENEITTFSVPSTTETLTFTVDNVDDPVLARDDSYLVFSGQTTILNPLGNDDAPDGGPVITSVDGQTIAIGQTRSLTGGVGDVTLNADGTLTFSAASSFTGQASFSYEMEDVDGSTDSATVVLNAPTWTITGDATAGEGASASYTIVLDAVPPMGTPVSVDIDAINVDTVSTDYGDLAAAVQVAADASPYFAFDGTTLTYVAEYESSLVSGSDFQDISSDPSATALGIGLFDPTQVNIGFDFEFYGESYNDLHVSDFGLLTFGGPSPGGGAAYGNTSFASGNTLGGLPAIAPFWDVIGMDRSNSDDVYTLTQGIPGEREFIVQYNEVVIYYNNSSSERLTFQAVLREGSNEIEFRYDDVTLSSSTYSQGNSATIGVSDGSGIRHEEFSFATASVSNNTKVVFSAENNSANRTLTFSLDALTDSTYEGSEDFRIALSNAQNSGVSPDLGGVTTAITDVNLAPVNSVPVTSGSAIPATTTAEDTSLIFNTANANAITISDTDGDSIDVTLSVTNGTLAVAGESGATVLGDGSANITLSGSQAQINAALDGLAFTGISDFNGSAVLTVTTDDTSGEANAVTISTIDLEVTPVTDTISDNGEIVSGNSVTINVLNNDTFSGPVYGMTVSSASNGTVVVNGDNTITYTWTDAASSGTDSFTYTVANNGVNETETVMVLKSVGPTPIDDTGNADEDNALLVDAASGVLSNDLASPLAPVLGYDTIDPGVDWDDASNSFPLRWGGGTINVITPSTGFSGITAAVAMDGSAGLTSVDLSQLAGDPSDESASFEIWFRYDPADYLSGNKGAILYETGNGTDGMSIALTDASGGGTGPIDHVQIMFNDGGTVVTQRADLSAILGAGNIASEYIQVAAVYEGDFSGSTDKLQLYVNGLLISESTTTGLDDWSNGDDAGLGTISNNPNVGTTDFGNYIGEIASFNFYGDVLTGQDVKTLFDAIAGLQVVDHDLTSAQGASVVVNADGSYSYDPSGSASLQALNSGDTVVDTFTYTVEDANGIQNSATVSITVLGINDAPGGADVSISINEDGVHVLEIADFGFDDPVDGVNDAFFGVVFTTIPGEGDLVYDDGMAPPSLVVAGQTVSTAGIASGYLRFVPDVDRNNDLTPGADYTSFTFQVVDDGGVANGGQNTDPIPNRFTISVAPVDDTVSHNLPPIQTASEDTNHSITGLFVEDVDGDILTTNLSVPASTGLLSVTTGTGAALTGNGTAAVTLVGTASQINAALAGLSYTPEADFNTDMSGPINLSIDTSDGGLPVYDTLAINVLSGVDGVADSVATIEGAAVTFDPLTGTGGASADNFESAAAAITAVTQGASGSVVLNASDEIVYTPDSSFNGLDTFTYTVTSGGVTETVNVSVNVSPVNNAPVANPDTATGAEDAGNITGDLLTNDSDPDGPSLSISQYTVDGIALVFTAGDTANIPVLAH